VLVAGSVARWTARPDSDVDLLAEGKRVLIDDEHRFDGVKVIGVDEHVRSAAP
jgi:predicted nucleotidyltransferase